MAGDLSRRKLLGGAIAGAAASGLGRSAEPKLPSRTLGRTGAAVPMLGIGCGVSWWQAYKEEERALEALTLALDLGITYVDTGQSYGKGLSESWVGKCIKRRRGEVFLATKISTRDGEEALRETDLCLKRMETDHVDLIHIHNLQGQADLDAIERKGGLVDVLHKLRGQKMTRFIGITSHHDPSTLKAALERHDFDCTQIALNAALQGAEEGHKSRLGHSFESVALPVAKKKNVGVIAMKVTGRNALLGEGPSKAGARSLLQYSLSLPVSLAVVGMSTLDQIRENAALLRDFKPMPEAQMKELSTRMAAEHKAALDRYFRDHVDA
ncbi:MAG: aldo/keto reductase [Bryobacteraceae bacterium]|nr:aldo/keto reductase [Bryobacteraceae bacterium]